MKTIIPVMIVALLGSVAVAQETGETPTAIIAKAELVETQEGDFALALRLYEQVLATKTLDATLRSDALLGKARLEHKLGRVDAAKVSLEKAAQGSGESATRAQRLLETGLVNQEEPGAWQVSGRVHRAIAKLYDRDSVTAAVNELQIIGESAIPALAEAMRNEKKDIGFITHGVQAMLAINGPRASKWFASVCADPDLIYRRTVMDALRKQNLLTQSGIDVIRTLDIAEPLKGLLDVADVDVALTALEALGGLGEEVAPETILALMERLREPELLRALQALKFPQLAASFLASETCRTRLRAQFGRLVGARDDDAASKVAEIVTTVMIQQKTVEAIDFWFQVHADLPPSTRLSGRTFPYHSMSPKFPLTRAVEHLRAFSDLHLDEFRGLQSGAEDTPFGQAHRAFEGILTRKVGSVSVPPTDQDKAAILDVIELTGRHHMNTNLEFRLSQGSLRDLSVRILNGADAFSGLWASISALRELSAGTIDLSSLDLGAIERLVMVTTDESPDSAKFYGNQMHREIIYALAQLPHDDAISVVLRLVAYDPRYYAFAADALSNLEGDSALEAKLDLVTRDCEDKLAPAGRNCLLWKLMRCGNPKAIPAILKALPMKLEERAQEGSVSIPSSGRAHAYHALIYSLEAWSPEDGLRLVQGVLGLDEPLKWGIIRTSLSSSTAKRHIQDGKVHQEILDLLVVSALEAPSETRQEMLRQLIESGLDQIASVRLLEGMARTKEFVYMSKVIEALPRPTPEALIPVMKGVLRDAELPEGNRQQILGTLAGLELQELRPELVAALDAPSSIARMHAMSGLFDLDRASALEDMIKLKDSPDHQVRARLCHYLGLEPRRESIPVLIEMLKDSSHDVRAAADSALRQIEFYFEQRNRWDKWLKKAGLDSTDAASALLEQAAPGQPLEQRVIAIQSLGTLAKAETLPILIGWMTDESPEVAAAARAAVNKINGK